MHPIVYDKEKMMILSQMYQAEVVQNQRLSRIDYKSAESMQEYEPQDFKRSQEFSQNSVRRSNNFNNYIHRSDRSMIIPTSHSPEPNQRQTGSVPSFVPEPMRISQFKQIYPKEYTQQIEDNLQVSLYSEYNLIGISILDRNDFYIYSIEQGELFKLQRLFNQAEGETIDLYFNPEMRPNLQTTIFETLKQIDVAFIIKAHHTYEIEILESDYTYLLEQANVDKITAVKVYSALPLLTEDNIESFSSQFQVQEQISKLEINDSLQLHLNIKKQTGQESLHSIFEQYLTTQQAKALLEEYILQPINSQRVLNQRFKYLEYMLKVMNSQPAQKLIPLLSKTFSFKQMLRVLNNKPDRSESYQKFYTSVQNSLHFINQIRSILIYEKRIGQEPCELLSKLVSLDNQKLENLLDLIEDSLVLTHPQVEIKPEFDEELAKVMLRQQVLNEKIARIESQCKTELLQLGIDFIINIVYLDNVYCIQTNYLTRSSVDLIYQQLNWRIIQQTRNNLYFQSAKTSQLDKEFGNLQEQILYNQQRVLLDVIQQIDSYSNTLNDFELAIGKIDYYLGLARAVVALKLVLPKFNTQGNIEIIGGRHLLVEQCENKFEANDFSTNKSRIFVISGPNFSGKSIYVSQIGIIAYLAHCGIPVPARRANISILNNICTLFSCQNNLTTLNNNDAELLQISRCIRQANQKSLILMDEIGKSKYLIYQDFKYQMGSNLQRSMLEWFYNIRPQTPIVLSATHYSTLNLDRFPLISVGHMQVHFQTRQKLIFVYKIDFDKSKQQQHSFGLEVALNIHESQQLYQRGLQIMQRMRDHDEF